MPVRLVIERDVRCGQRVPLDGREVLERPAELVGELLPGREALFAAGVAVARPVDLCEWLVVVAFQAAFAADAVVDGAADAWLRE